MTEIKRVLVHGGFLLARVNSVQDKNHGAGQGVVIEENYYNVNGNFKRFFDKVQLDELFKAWEVKYIQEHEMGRYKNSKMLWEIAVKSIQG